MTFVAGSNLLSLRSVCVLAELLATGELVYGDVCPATLLLKTDKNQAALVYRQLLDRNPENPSYFCGLEKALEPCE